MLHGVVPLGSGLSSSAAFVVSCSIAIAAAYGLELTKGEVAKFTASSEQHVGVTSGGMDQAISVMGMPGLAMLVDFNPVRATEVQLPAGATFVVGHSLAVSKKQETADKKYNLRVVECRLAAALLAKHLGVSSQEAAAITTLKEIEPMIAASEHGPGLPGKEAAVKALLHEGAYMQEEIESLLGVKLADVFKGKASPLRVLEVCRDDGYQLRNRALHVYSEAARVVDFKAVCDSEDSNNKKLSALGVLMDASHASCRDLYQCSCDELDQLVGVAKKAGALGARLTGAGWGGCTVSLVLEDEAPAFIAAVKEQYYGPLIAQGRLAEEDVGQFLFASKPSSGAAILHLKMPKEPAEAGQAAETAAAEAVELKAGVWSWAITSRADSSSSSKRR